MDKLILCLMAALLISDTAISQIKNYKKNTIAVLYYNPVDVGAADRFTSDEWILYGKQSRTNTKYAIGLEYKHYLSKSFALKFWGGIAERSIEETVTGEGVLYLDTSWYTGTVTETGNYDQTSFNINAGINYSKSFGDFGLNSGFELSYLHSGEGEENIDYVFSANTNPGMYVYKDSYVNNISPGSSFGLGFFLGAEYDILDNLTAGAELHQFLFYSVFNDDTEYSNQNSVTLGEEYFSYSSSGKRKEDFKQFAFSSILPVIQLRYKF